MSAPSRRWPRVRFRLWHLLALVTLLCGWLGYETNRARHLERIARGVAEADGLIGYRMRFRFTHDGWMDHYGLQKLTAVEQAVWVQSHPAPHWIQRLLGDYYFVDPNVVYLLDPTACERLLPELCRFKKLEAMHLKITDKAQLAPLTKLKRLRYLQLSGPIEDASVSLLASLKSLSRLEIVDTQISYSASDHLQMQLQNCEIIDRRDLK